ncbi:uncharacterized protein PG998_013497 [Apiospora kogelbergensis]|uniref:Uncharacterized protein n=1 Tax=Apiospora kogelbergensis TaxID=1337665 RepID=A0AAW0R183_9PEZI
MRNIFVPLLAALAASVAKAADPTPPGYDFLYTVNATLSPAIQIGDGPQGNRVAIPIIGGEFHGPKLNGKVLNLGADWGLTDKFGTFHPDTRYHFQTDDGANIFIRTSGPAQADGSIHLHVVFETGHPDYYWLNNVVAVGVLHGGDGYVVIDTWRMTTPAAS